MKKQCLDSGVAIATALFLLTVVCGAEPPSESIAEPWGMRLRPRPARIEEVWAPAVVRESPGNEACVVRLPDDSLRVFSIARPEGKELRSIASSDGGLTWGGDRLEFALPGAAYHGIQVLVDRRQEFQATFHIFRGTGKQPGVDRNLDLWHARTTSQRKNWQPPQKMFEGYVGSIRGFIQLKSGRLIQPFARAVPERWKAPPAGEPDYGWHNTVVYYSDDDGTTWQRSPQELKIELCGPNTTRYGAIEPNVLELTDGRTWMLIRDRCGRLYESYSSDGGIAWTKPEKTRFISSDSPAWTLRLADGRIVIFWSACQRWDNPRSYAMGGREALHAAISRDEGKTWRGFREVLLEPAVPATRGDRGAAYPTAAQNKAGKVVLVSGQGEGRKAIVAFDPDWLEESAVRDDFKSGLAGWSAYGASGVRLVETEKKGAQALEIRRIDAKLPAGATWSFPASKQGTLTLRLKVGKGFSGVSLSLTDCFSVIGDTKAAENAIFHSLEQPGGFGDKRPLGPGEHTLTLGWKEDSAELQLDGSVTKLPAIRPSDSGPCYLRLVALAQLPEEGALTVEWVEMKSSASPAGKKLSLERRPGKTTGGAVLDVGEAGSFDADWATCPAVVFAQGKYWMYYSAYYDAKQPRGGIGLATSSDGLTWKRENAGRPILTVNQDENAWDGGQVMGPEAYFDGKKWLLWFTGMAQKRHKSQIGFYEIGLATSDDGIHFQRVNAGRPVLTRGPPDAFDEVQAATPSILREKDRFRMWYAAWSPRFSHTICTATSQDGIDWTAGAQRRPIFGLEPAEAFGHAVCRKNDGYLLLYMALRTKPGLYAASSTDGEGWTMLNDGEPVLTPGAPDAFDRRLVGHPFLFPTNDNRLLVWYTGYADSPGTPNNWRLRIGLAEAMLDK